MDFLPTKHCFIPRSWFEVAAAAFDMMVKADVCRHGKVLKRRCRAHASLLTEAFSFLDGKQQLLL